MTGIGNVPMKRATEAREYAREGDICKLFLAQIDKGVGEVVAIK